MVRGRWLPGLSAAAAWLSLWLLAAWAMGRVWTDRFWVTQALYLMPTAVTLAVAGSVWLLSFGLGAMSLRSAGVRGRGVGLVMLMLAAGWWVAGELRLQRSIWGASAAGLGSVRLPSEIRFGFVNLAARGHRSATTALAQGVDVLVVANARLDADPGMDQPGVPAFERATLGVEVTGAAEVGRVREAWLSDIVPPVAGIAPAELTGRVTAVELTVAGVEGALVVWVVDLPSSQWLSRPAVMRAAREAIVGGVTDGGDGGGGAWWAGPDVVMGDFNAPAGAWSAGLLAGEGMVEAGAACGWGWRSTWPAGGFAELSWLGPQWAIDQVWLGQRWRAVWQRVVEVPGSAHRAVVVGMVGVAPQGGG